MGGYDSPIMKWIKKSLTLMHVCPLLDEQLYNEIIPLDEAARNNNMASRSELIGRPCESAYLTAQCCRSLPLSRDLGEGLGSGMVSEQVRDWVIG